jgi:hypothetical protein
MDKQTVLEETEKALDVIEDKLDEIEKVEEVIVKNKTASIILIGAGVVLVAASSAFAGYKFAERRLKTKYDALAAQELDEAKEYYRRLYKTDEFATPEAAVKVLVPEEEQELDTEEIAEARTNAENYVTTSGHVSYDKVQGEKLRGAGVKITKEEKRIEVESTNVFDNSGPDHVDWVYADEVKLRTPDKPYIITEEEYLANDPEHEQTSLTYFEEDGVLADAADKVIDETDMVVGDDNLVKFGKGSRNKDIVFIRNEAMECDFEVERSRGSYVEEALGIRHSDDDRRIRKFRRGDDG